MNGKGLTSVNNILLFFLYVLSYLVFLRLSFWSSGFTGFVTANPVILAKVAIRGVTFFVAILYCIKYFHSINQFIRTPYLEMLFFLMVAFFSLTYSADFSYSAFRVIEHAGYFVFSFVIVVTLSKSTQSPDDVLKLGVNLVLYGLVSLVAVVWLASFVAPEYAYRHLIGDINGFGGAILHVHTLGIIAAIIYAVNMCRLFSSYGGNKIMNIVMSACMLWTIYLTHSRTSLLISFVITMVVIFQSSKNTYKVLLYLFIGSIGLVIFIMKFDELIEYVLRGQQIGDLIQLTERVRFWRVIIADTLTESPLLGYGYQMMSNDGISKYFADLQYSRSNAHNTFIQTFSGLGLLGTAVLFYHLFVVAKSFRYVYNRVSGRVRDRVFELIVILIACILASLTQYGIVGMTTPVVPAYLMIIMLITYLRIKLVGVLGSATQYDNHESRVKLCKHLNGDN
jgi:hypothetical protein